MYLTAFWDLDTERASGGGTLGRIPWSRAREYAREELGFADELLRPFWWIVRAMDAGYAGWQREQFKRTRGPQAPPAGGTTRTAHGRPRSARRARRPRRTR